MGLVSKVLTSLFGGVSQQPATLRLDNQCELMENFDVSIVHGLKKRPPTEFVSGITTALSNNVSAHLINRDANEQYLVLFTGDATDPIEVYTLNGTKCTVQYGTLNAAGGGFVPDASVKNYVVNSDPNSNIRATTIADYTILSNAAKVPAMSGAPATSNAPMAILHVNIGQPTTTYEVWVNDVKWVSFTSGTSSGWSQTDVIATNIYNILQSGLVAADPTNWNVVREGSSIVIWRTDKADFDLRVHDAYGDTALTGIKGSTQKFEDLPLTLPVQAQNTVVEIAGLGSDQFDSYYVKWTLDNDSGEGTQGYWKETLKDGLDNTFDDATLPHRMVRTGTNEFTVAPVIWENRQIGDAVTAPEPSFIGKFVADVFMHKNRLGFLSGENVILSRTSDFFNFWPTTATEVLDDDPIDVAVSSNEVSVLRYGVPFHEQLLLFADQIQFVMSAGDRQLLTPKSAACDVSTHFEINSAARPVAIGPNVYFAEPKGASSALREYFVQPGSYINDAADVSAHVPTYIPSNLQVLAASPAFNTIFAAAPLSKTLYAYRFHWNGDQKVMSAWGKWVFDEPIYAAATIQNYLYLVIKPYPAVFTIVKINLEHITTGNLGFRVHLDNQKLLTGVYAGGNTTWTLPHYDASANIVVVDSVTGAQIPSTYRGTDLTVVAPGDYSANQCYVGKNYTARYRFSEWGIKAPNTNVASLQGRLTMRTLTLNFVETGYFKIEVTAGARSTATHMMTGVVEGQSIYSTPTIFGKDQRVNIRANAKDTTVDIVNDTYLPCQFSTAAWEGDFTVRNRML